MAFKLCDAGQGPCVQGHHVQRGVRRYRLTVGHRARLAPVGRQGVSLSQLWTASPFITSGGGAGYTWTNNRTGNILQISSRGRVSDPAPVPINASSLFTFDS
jgi:hypothetical protein